MRGLLPAVAESLAPGGDDGVDLGTLGVTPEAIREFALGGLRRRLEIVGVPLESL